MSMLLQIRGDSEPRLAVAASARLLAEVCNTSQVDIVSVAASLPCMLLMLC